MDGDIARWRKSANSPAYGAMTYVDECTRWHVRPGGGGIAERDGSCHRSIAGRHARQGAFGASAVYRD